MCTLADRKPRSYHRWTPEEDEIIRRDYRGGLASRESLAGRLGVTENAIHARAAVLGCQRDDSYVRHAWSEVEEEQLRQMVGSVPSKEIARRMHRSINSVTVRAKRLNLSHRARDGWYTQREAAEILGVDDKWVARQIEAGCLKASWHHGLPVARSPRRIEARDLRQFIIDYAARLQGHRVDLVQMVFLLAEKP